MSIFLKMFGDPNERQIRKLQPVVDHINGLEKEFESFSDEKIAEETKEFKRKIKNSQTLDNILPRAFALCREAAKRTLGQRHFDVQLIGGIVLHQGKIAEMKTGEGKTLAATLSIYLNALSGGGVHVITVNDYLARRDTVWMGQVYYALGLSVGCITHEAAYIYDPVYKQENPNDKIQMSNQIQNPNNQRDETRDELGSFRVVESYLRPISRKEAYAADITYGTNNEFAFDYLRDNMAYTFDDVVQRGFHYAIVDEVDSILIDEARTPLIISIPDTEAPKLYQDFAKIVPRLKENIDYNIDEKRKAVTLSEEGLEKIEKILGIGNIWQEKGVRLVRHLEQALKAQVLFQKDRDYVVHPADGGGVKSGEVIIVDEFTGRLMPGRRYSEGLHQAIEAKEGVAVQQESRTLATVTFQNYFRMYEKLAGMTGTAATNAEEFSRVYKLDVIIIPTNKPMIRKYLPDRVYRTDKGKFQAVVREIKERNQKEQPVLVGTTSIEKNEFLSKLLEREGVPHQVLNAKNHEKEAAIIAQAGKLGAVTVATNMAGRGVDIMLGGIPPSKSKIQNPKSKIKEDYLDRTYEEWEREHDEVVKLGGLFVLGTERHEARRIDNQLRGRSGRQGDPGSSQFFVSLEDDLMRIFGGEKMKELMGRLGVPEDQPIENKMISGAIESAQEKIEGYNFDIRKHVLEYDEVLNKHRDRVYKTRRQILEKPKIMEMIEEEIRKIVDFHTQASHYDSWNIEEIFENIKSIFPVSDEVHKTLSEKRKSKSEEARAAIIEYLIDLANRAYENKEKEVGEENMRQIEKAVMLRNMDMIWMEHLENMEHLRDSVQLRAYGQRDPLIEYKNEGHRMFGELLSRFQTAVVNTIFKVGLVGKEEKNQNDKAQIIPNQIQSPKSKTTGRNDPCSCGSGKKFKKCHGA